MIKISYNSVPLMNISESMSKYIKQTNMFDVSDYFNFPEKNHGYLSSSIKKNHDTGHYLNLQPGQLYWPTGATRFACGLFLITSEYLEKLPGFDVTGKSDSEDVYGGLRPSVYGVTDENIRGYTPKDLTVSTGDVSQSFSMWMLPPKPLFQLSRSYDSSKTNTGKIPSIHKSSLWVLPLVDARYWWWSMTTGKYNLPKCTASWSDLFKSIFGNLGYRDNQIIVDTIHEDYLLPHEIFQKADNEFKVPYLLDSMSQSCGSKILSMFNGNVRVMNSEKSLEEYEKLHQLQNSVKSGGFGSLISTDKAQIINNFTSGSEIKNDITKYTKFASSFRDTPGVLPTTLSFILDGTVKRTSLLTDLENEVNSNGNDTLNNSAVSGATVHYFRSDLENEPITPPMTFPKFTNGSASTGTESIAVSVVSGDVAYDLRTNLMWEYTFDWVGPLPDKSLISKHLKLNMSSYKSKAKTCTASRLPATINGVKQSDKVFSEQQISRYMNRFKKDYVAYQMSDVGLTLNGVDEIPLNGMIDYVKYDMTDRMGTKIMRAPYNPTVEEIFVESYLGSGGACDEGVYPCGSCLGYVSYFSSSEVAAIGSRDQFLPFSPVLSINRQSDPLMPSGQADPVLYNSNRFDHVTPPPYVIRFCLGSGIGTVALDYAFHSQANVQIYWNGALVQSRQIYGNTSFSSCASCKENWGRMTFNKTLSSPGYALVVVTPTDSLRSNYPNLEIQAMYTTQFELNMRCVGDFPSVPPSCTACQVKMDEVGGVFTLGMFTSIPVVINGTGGGITPRTRVCPIETDVTQGCGSDAACPIPKNLIMSFSNIVKRQNWLEYVTPQLVYNSYQGGWYGIWDNFGPNKMLIQFALRLFGTNQWTLRITNLLDKKEHVTTGTLDCRCSPFQLNSLNNAILKDVGSTTYDNVDIRIQEGT